MTISVNHGAFESLTHPSCIHEPSLQILIIIITINITILKSNEIINFIDKHSDCSIFALLYAF